LINRLDALELENSV